jgi:nucleoside-diphosphate-sugar epimerase
LSDLLEDVEVIEGDIQSYERVHNSVAGCDAVFHLASLPSVPRSVQDPLTSNATNVIGTLNVLLAARDSGVRRVVYASSSSVYGANPALCKREDLVPAPLSPYAVAKLAGEGYCRRFSEVFGIETVGLRYFNVFGPRQDPLSQYAAGYPGSSRPSWPAVLPRSSATASNRGTSRTSTTSCTRPCSQARPKRSPGGCTTSRVGSGSR